MSTSSHNSTSQVSCTYSSSERTHEAGQDKNDTCLKDAASEKSVNSTDRSEIQKEERSKLTEEENKTEAPNDGEEQHENKIFETEERTGVKYCCSRQEAVSGQYVTVTAVKKDAASENFKTEERTGVKYCFSTQESVSGQDVIVTAVKKDTASEKLVNITDLSSKLIKLPPLEHTVATVNPDLETVDEIQTKTKKEKRRSKLTEDDNKTEAPSDGEEQHENKISVNSTDLSSKVIKLPPLEDTMATGNPDLEMVDKIQTKTKKEKRRSKLTEDENKIEVPSDGEEQHENKISVNSTDLSSKLIKLPPLEHTMATGNPDLETVDEIPTKTKKEKRSKRKEEGKKTKCLMM